MPVSLFLTHVALHDDTFLFVLAAVGLILSIIETARAHGQSLLTWAVVAVSLALVILWWPT